MSTRDRWSDGTEMPSSTPPSSPARRDEIDWEITALDAQSAHATSQSPDSLTLSPGQVKAAEAPGDMARVHLTFYPELGEAVASIPFTPSPHPEGRIRSSEETARRSDRRARSTARRYALRNDLHVRTTLTIPKGIERHDLRVVKAFGVKLMKMIRRSRDQARFPYIITAEPHPRRRGGGLHLNAVLPFTVDKNTLAVMWTKVLRCDNSVKVQVDVRDDAERDLHDQAAASVEYVFKEARSFYERNLDLRSRSRWVGINAPAGTSLYTLGRGFMPLQERYEYASFEAAYEGFTTLMGAPGRVAVSSITLPTTGAPPFAVFRPLLGQGDPQEPRTVTAGGKEETWTTE